MRPMPISILEGDTFVVSDRRGDIAISPEEAQGLFDGDTRYLSRWILTVNGALPNPLSTDDVNYFSSQFFLVPGTGTIYVDAPMSIVRQRAVGGGFHEDLKVTNHKATPIDVDIRIEADADFADLFQVKDKQFKRAQELKAANTVKLERNESGAVTARLRHLATRVDRTIPVAEVPAALKQR